MDIVSNTGIFPAIPNEVYHAHNSVSKSGLWTIYTKSPRHFKYEERKETAAFDLGTAVHTAILEPETFEGCVMRGPEDRRGNKWKDAEAEAINSKRLLLTAGDYDAALAMREIVHASSTIRGIINGKAKQVEYSGFWNDAETGQLCRCRPDLYRGDIGVMLDLKTTASAHPDDFAKAVINYGYHAQEAFYTDGYRTLGQEVGGFLFLVVEKTFPHVVKLYELPPSIVEEGRAICRKALDQYADCATRNVWPGYPGEEVTELKFKRWAYVETPAPEGEE